MPDDQHPQKLRYDDTFLAVLAVVLGLEISMTNRGYNSLVRSIVLVPALLLAPLAAFVLLLLAKKES